MQRTIKRSYTLTPKEVRQAIMAWLKERDVPYPKDECDLEVDSTGASIEWVEETEDETV